MSNQMTKFSQVTEIGTEFYAASPAFAAYLNSRNSLSQSVSEIAATDLAAKAVSHSIGHEA